MLVLEDEASGWMMYALANLHCIPQCIDIHAIALTPAIMAAAAPLWEVPSYIHISVSLLASLNSPVQARPMPAEVSLNQHLHNWTTQAICRTTVNILHTCNMLAQMSAYFQMYGSLILFIPRALEKLGKWVRGSQEVATTYSLDVAHSCGLASSALLHKPL